MKSQPLTNSMKSYLRKSQCGFKSRQPIVCCRYDEIAQEIKSNKIQKIKTNLLPPPGICGRIHWDRIVGGTTTRIDEFPWTALLEFQHPNGIGLNCGGALISKSFVVTAAHCVVGKSIPKNWKLSAVRLGEWDVSKDPDCDDGDCSDPILRIPIAKRIPHGKYISGSKNQDNDIALLKLERSVQFSDFVRPICLNQQKTKSNLIGVGLDVAGWGKTENSSGSNIKLKVRVNGVSFDSCKSIYEDNQVYLTENHLCAGGVSGYDSCRGDSGGPLMSVEYFNGQPYWFLQGIVSFGPVTCAMEGWPGVYTKVSNYVDWIISNMD